MTIVKSGFWSLYLLSVITLVLRLLVWVAADKSRFHPLTKKKIHIVIADNENKEVHLL